MADNGSVAPKERVNIVYKSETGGAKEEVELPLKQLVLGDFTQREDSTPVDQRKTVSVDKTNFNEVLRAHGLTLDLAVPNRLAGAPEAGAEEELMNVHLEFDNIRAFEPDAIVDQVPELQQLVLLREALKALKGPLGNLPEFRKRLQDLVKDEGTRARLLAELGASHEDDGGSSGEGGKGGHEEDQGNQGDKS
ncbi:type VI secretion system contractile sheath small subunit [Paraburkholderia bonniea]|uniref:type VI secretion system contractile sheath small subunit n=1 Tax=Paraburkholderia bonniea TaxID=2152891 RepID=UPI00129168C4|nr:type VI secretion system contractile sheath small subunit [Paraburkholderia bonniea]WJF89279.1 type VI secretion system contractile sheath small subunit [Paraburkholderia bonniea]WJF92595.1 type VI secretion system contractile sheath small subunit [Paraburkholderia bonniea]